MKRLDLWHTRALRPPFGLRDIELTQPLPPVRLADSENGAHVLLRHRGRPVGRIWLSRAEHGPVVSVDRLAPLVAEATHETLDALLVTDALIESWVGDAPAPSVPDLTVAVCTRDRPDLLRRCLAALTDMRGAAPGIDILVVDNAPPDDGTQRATAEFLDVRYVVEPVPGLNFGRNRALASTERRWTAFVDDDAVVDRGWLMRLAEAIAHSPDAACFTGPILPLVLATEAQIRFERAGGFGKGFVGVRYGADLWGDPVYPTGAGRFGTGACMVFDRQTVLDLGGFDPALDTGPPLPGGGDIDMFYRIVRANHRLVYVPGLVVHHEHRRDMRALARQYGSWGRSIMALVRKNDRADPEMRLRQRKLLLWWGRKMARQLARALVGRGYHPPGFILAEIKGAVIGYFGEYSRSQARMAERRRRYGA